jgi:hypothetical protein
MDQSALDVRLVPIGDIAVYSTTSVALSRIEVGAMTPSDLAASYFTTTVVPTDTRL